MILVAAASKAVHCKQLVIFTAFSPMTPRRRGSKGSALLTTCFFHCLFAHDTGFRRIQTKKNPAGCMLACPHRAALALSHAHVQNCFAILTLAAVAVYGGFAMSHDDKFRIAPHFFTVAAVAVYGQA